MRRMIRWGAGICALFLAIMPAGARPRGLTISGSFSAAGIITRPRLFGAGVEATLPLLADRLEVGAGLRAEFGLVQPNPGITGFLRAGFLAPCRWWWPAAGLELGFTSTSRSLRLDEQSVEAGLQHDREAAAAADHVRLAGYVVPLRFVWRWLVVSIFEVSLGTPLSPRFGQRLDIGVGVLKLGWRFQ